MLQSKIVPNFVSGNCSNGCTTLSEIDQVIANVDRGTRSSDERQTVSNVIANVSKSWNAFNKIQIDHVSIRAAQTSTVPVGDDSIQIVVIPGTRAVANVDKGIIDSTRWQKFDVDVGLCKNLVDTVFNVRLLS